ncbi:MAG TPA: DNA repair protein RadA [Lachnospiraceae bacterium]|nr:DNA repair protein RadA [Lachnospiraceae bacterium]
MAKEKTLFFCKECGTEVTKWTGQCPGCRAWNTLVEAPAGQAAKLKTKAVSESRKKAATSGIGKKPVTMKEVDSAADTRQPVGLDEFDRVLGGGIVPGSLILVGGDPGIGKSTLLLQTCRLLSSQGVKTLYVSGEESEKQIKLRADRIGDFADGMLLFSETAMSEILTAVDEVDPQVLVVDSIQTVYEESIDAAPGSVSQVREITGILLQLAKSRGITVFIVGHVTKEGNVAGPRMLEHMVDIVLYFEGDKTAMYRMLRGVKNRFGSTNEVGVFEMREQGLVEVPNPSEYLMQGRLEGEAGSVVVCAMEGSRPFLIEVQALVCRSSFPVPRRTAVGTDYNRVNLLMAVLEKRIGLSLGDCDAYVNVAGGMRIVEPALDLAMVAALISSHTGKAFDPKTIFFGEVGLVGEVRAVSQAERRLSEAVKSGYTTIIMPESNRVALERAGVRSGAARIVGINHIRELA